ncbi:MULTISPECIES: hypothetical protein [Paraburkholderia]|uniref:hypothetical protein n=1 Tax=Paraburkholderia TaxID=1822464 RepID=UPI0022547E47|nr:MULTISPECIES: hypothetical protein [Paraburkholderia]MCX4164584.1 hypothetical protein [Paraburkholderia megapolitana]MDN7160077.1 TniQ family protein [Paraburkholderia sp. CHISQ3]MDQ6497124.1 TniQ family protein [Paraburkholderia megapolitana]
MNAEQISCSDWRIKGIALFSGRFLMRPSAIRDESFPGYRLRVAAANGLANPNWLGCVESSLPKTHGIARWCPHCLAESDCYWRESWYAGPAACLKHCCWLTAACGDCQRMLRWKHVRFANCVCGARLQDVDACPFSAELQQLVGDRQDSDTGGLSVGECWRLARFLGALSQFGLCGKPLKKASRQAENIEQLMVTAGASLIVDQAACFDLLDRLRAPPVGVSNVPLLSEVFPHLLTMLRKRLNEAERCWMLNLLDAYVTDSSRNVSPVLWERKGVAGRAGWEPGGRQKTRNPAIATVLAQTGVIVPVRRTRAGRQKFVISRTDLQGLQKTQRSLVTLKTAARYAGMSSRRIEALAKAGLITSTATRIDKRSIDHLLDSIVGACARDAPALDDPVSVADALRLYVPVEASAVFFDRLVSGNVRLVPTRIKMPMLRQIFVDRCDVAASIRVAVESGSALSIVEAARRLSVKQEMMYHLVNIGLVRTRTGKLRRRAARVIEADDLLKFTEQFAPLLTMAKAVGVSPRQAPEWARQNGVELITGPSVDGGRQYWIRRPAGVDISRGVIPARVKD